MNFFFALCHKLFISLDTDKQGTSEKWKAVCPYSVDRPEDSNQPRHKLTLVSLTESDAIRKEIEGLEEKYDVIVIDGAPKLDKISTACIAFSDIVLIPVTPSPNDLWSNENIVERVKGIQHGAEDIRAFFLINRDKPITKLSHEMQEALDALGFPAL